MEAVSSSGFETRGERRAEREALISEAGEAGGERERARAERIKSRAGGQLSIAQTAHLG